MALFVRFLIGWNLLFSVPIACIFQLYLKLYALLSGYPRKGMWYTLRNETFIELKSSFAWRKMAPRRDDRISAHVCNHVATRRSCIAVIYVCTRENIKSGRKNANGPGPRKKEREREREKEREREREREKKNRVPATSSPSARRRNLIKRLLAARRGLSTFRHLADTGRHSLTSLHAYTVAPRVRETRVLSFAAT